jgi:hypothetical protein
MAWCLVKHRKQIYLYLYARKYLAQLEDFWVVTPWSIVVRYRRFRGPCCLHLYCEDGGSIDLRNVDILPQHYTASQHRRSQYEFSPPWKVKSLEYFVIYTSCYLVDNWTCTGNAPVCDNTKHYNNLFIKLLNSWLISCWLNYKTRWPRFLLQTTFRPRPPPSSFNIWFGVNIFSQKKTQSQYQLLWQRRWPRGLRRTWSRTAGRKRSQVRIPLRNGCARIIREFSCVVLSW